MRLADVVHQLKKRPIVTRKPDQIRQKNQKRERGAEPELFRDQKATLARKDESDDNRDDEECDAVFRLEADANENTEPNPVTRLIAIDRATGRVVIASATCVDRDDEFLPGVQAVVVPGKGVAACQAAVDNTHTNQMLVFQELQKGTDPKDIIELLVSRVRDAGLAMMLVTHDPLIAAHADRVLTMADGLLT